MTIHKAAQVYELPYRLLRRLVEKGLIKTIPHPIFPEKRVIDPSEGELLQALSEFYALRRGLGGGRK